MAELLYGFDPMCGWCYGFAPALSRLLEAMPSLHVQIEMSGLFVGARARPYKDMVDYISRAAPKMEAVTGQLLGEGFHHMMRHTDARADSAPPVRAIVAVQRAAPDRVLDFVHELQRAHFVDGEDICEPGPVERVAARVGAPALALPGYEDTTHLHPDVVEAFARGKALGIRSFPSLAVRAEPGAPWRWFDVEYDPEVLLRAVRAHVA